MNSEKQSCSLCAIKPYFYEGLRGDEKEYSKHESSRVLSSGPWSWLKVCKDQNDRLAIYAVGDEDTELYYPNFCPECGRKLT